VRFFWPYAGLTRDTIVKIESEAVQPREGTIADILRVFDENGVEFIDSSGVRLKTQGVDILVGQEGLQRFFSGVYDYSRKHGGTIVQFGVEDGLFGLTGVEFLEMHRRRMVELIKQRRDVKVQAILGEGDRNMIASEYIEYRWIGQEVFSPVPFYVYGECLGMMATDDTSADDRSVQVPGDRCGVPQAVRGLLETGASTRWRRGWGETAAEKKAPKRRV